MVQNLKWATAHLSRRLGAGLGARHSDTARRRSGGACGTQVGAGRACVLGVKGACAAGRSGR